MTRLPRTLSLTAAFVCLASLIACGSPAAPAEAPASPPSTPAASAPATGNVKAVGEAAVGDTTKCPVSGEEFVVQATSPKVEHGGKTYYFCCGGCKQKFEADPSKFVTKG